MPLRFFADHCISNLIVKMLRDAGHEVLLLKEHIPVDSPDPLVISKAQELYSILISLNGDFSDIVTYPPANYCPVPNTSLHYFGVIPEGFYRESSSYKFNELW